MGEAGGPLRGGVWRQQGSRPGIPARGRAGGDGVRDVGRHGLDALSRDRSARRRTLLPSGAGPVSATRNRGERGSRGGMLQLGSGCRSGTLPGRTAARGCARVAGRAAARVAPLDSRRRCRSARGGGSPRRWVGALLPVARAARRDRHAPWVGGHSGGPPARRGCARLADPGGRGARRSLARREPLARRRAGPRGDASAGGERRTRPPSPVPRPSCPRLAGSGLPSSHGCGRSGARTRGGARLAARSHVWREGVRRVAGARAARVSTHRVLAYLCVPGPPHLGALVVTALPTVDLTVYPLECDAFGHLNHASVLALFERARWESLARGPGMDLFHRTGVAPVVRKATVDYRAAAFPGDVLRVETVITHRGTTSWTARQTARRARDGTVIAEAEIVFVCVDGAGRPVPLPGEVARVLGPRSTAAHAPQRIAVDGAELAVEVRGEGGPVLFVHGFPFDRTVWRHQLAALSRWKRIAPDLRGAGESTAPPDGYTIARYADDLVAVLDALGVRQAVVCGLSLGGYIAFELLRRHAGRVRAVVLCDTRPQPDTLEAKRGRDELTQVAQREGQDAVIERLLPRLLAPETLATQPEVAAQVREMAGRWSAPGLVGALRMLRDRPDSTETLRGVRLPTLVLVGSEDEIAPPETGRPTAQLIPDAQYHAVPAAGQLGPLEQPLATTRA